MGLKGKIKKNCGGTCDTPKGAPLTVVLHDCETEHEICTPVYYNGLYYIAQVAGATGKPDLAEDADQWLGGFAALDATFFKAMTTCVGCCDPDTNTTYVINTNDAGGQDLVGSDGSVQTLVDEHCKLSTAENEDGEIVFSATCTDENGIETTSEVARVPAQTMDTLNNISEPNANGIITVTRPDGSVVQILTSGAVTDAIADAITEALSNLDTPDAAAPVDFTSDCFELTNLSNSCGSYSTPVLVQCPDDPDLFSLGVLPDGVPCYGAITNAAAGYSTAELFPPDPTTAVADGEMYIITDLNADDAAGTIDFEKLQNSEIGGGEHRAVPCDGTYTLNVQNRIEFESEDPERVAIFVTLVTDEAGNTDLGRTASGAISAVTPFGNGDSSMEDSMDLVLPAGINTITKHLVAVAAFEPVQVQRHIGTTQLCKQEF